MKPKHLHARIDQCLRNAELSRCPRRKFGAMLIDPRTNSILADGYNGPPRGEEGLCAGSFCVRNGASVTVDTCPTGWAVYSNVAHPEIFLPSEQQEARAAGSMLAAQYPPIKSGTHMEAGCHHAEANVLANAVRRGVSTEGAWLIVTGEPCMMCAKYAHHGGIAKVFVVKGGYAGGDAGVKYLEKYGVVVDYVDGPQDPRRKEE